MNTQLPKIVIVGGGAGGLELATQLGHKLGKKRQAEILLIDKNRSHIWKPLLHEVATGSIDADLDGVVYSAHAAKHYYQFQLGSFSHVDSTNNTITLSELKDELGHRILPKRQVSYDYLVLAIGSISNDFNTPGSRIIASFSIQISKLSDFSMHSSITLHAYTKTMTRSTR